MTYNYTKFILGVRYKLLIRKRGGIHMKNFFKITNSLDLLKVTVTCIVGGIAIFYLAQFIGGFIGRMIPLF